MKFYNNIIGDENASVTLPFVSSDNEHMLESNKNTAPKNWIYHNIDISYQHNNYGHRSKSIEDVDLDNYILFAGCSHTYGVGLPLEETYAYKLAKHLKLDYYNASVVDADNFVIFNNLYNWSLMYPRPKLVVAQWTNPLLYTVAENDFIKRFGINDYSIDINDFIYLSHDSGYTNLKMYLYSKIIETTFGIPVIHVGFFKKYTSNMPDGIVLTNPIDRARDLGGNSDNGHYGIKTQNLIVQNIMTRPTQTFQTVWDLLQKTR